MKLKIREEKPSDYSEVYEMVTRSFATTDECDGDEQDYLNEIRKRDTFIPELSLVAETDSGKLVGQIVLYKMEIKTKSKILTELVLSPLSVDPDYFRKGIARALVEESILRAKNLGYSAIFLCGNPNIYMKLCFKPSFNYNIFHVNDSEKNAQWCLVREIKYGYLSGLEGTVDIE